MRWLTLLVPLMLTLPVHAVSLQESQLEETLKTVAERSSKGTPRPLNDDIVDQGYAAKGNELVNFLSVAPEYAESMQEQPLIVRTQLQDSVCSDQQYRRLLDMGATLTYHFVLTGTTQPVLTQRFVAAHCQAL